MRLIAIALFWCTQVQAQAPQTVVAQTLGHLPERTYLLTTPCGTQGLRTAQRVTAAQTLRWGCWGYNETGVQVIWTQGHQQQIWWRDLWRPDGAWWQPMGYDRMWHTLQVMQTQ